MRVLRLVLAATFVLACAAPAAAQRYTAKQNGDVIELADTTAQMNVSVVSSLGDAWRIQVKGQNLVRTSATLEDFVARLGFNGMPLLAPFANRLDETAFYADVPARFLQEPDLHEAVPLRAHDHDDLSGVGRRARGEHAAG